MSDWELVQRILRIKTSAKIEKFKNDPGWRDDVCRHSQERLTLLKHMLLYREFEYKLSDKTIILDNFDETPTTEGYKEPAMKLIELYGSQMK